MKSKFRFADIRISTKLWVISGLICGIFLVISLVIFWAFHHSHEIMRAVIVGDIRNVSTNALTEREVLSIHSDTMSLLDTSLGKGATLKIEGNRLRGRAEELVNRNKGRVLEKPLKAFSRNLSLLLAQCVAVNHVLSLLDASEADIHNTMFLLEEIISQNLIDLTIQDEDTAIMEQLASLVAGYHTSLLEIAKLRAESWPVHYYGAELLEDDVILAALDELILRCRTLTASDLDVARLGQNLITQLLDFRKNNEALHRVMFELDRRKKALERARATTGEIMAALDRDVVRAIEAVDTKLDRSFRITGIITLLLATFLMVALGFLTSAVFRRVIRNPILAIRKGIEGFERGDLDTRIHLGRSDEWRVIEEALNSMAEQLSESYDTLRFKEHIIESTIMAIVTTDMDRLITYANPSFLEIWAIRNPSEIIGRPLEDFWVLEGRSEEMKRMLRKEGSWRDEIKARRVDGSIFHVQVSAGLVLDPEGRPIAIMLTSIDITDRKKAEAELDRLRNLLKNIVDSMPSILVAVDKDGRVTQWNREVESVTGISTEEARGRSLLDVFPQLGSEMEKVRQAIESRIPLKDGRVPGLVEGGQHFSDVTVYPLISNGMEGAVIRVDDVTERVRMEEMMIQSEKMLSVGGLAAGMAHEINNPLASVLQNAQVVINRISQDLPANQRAAEKSGTTVGAIKSFMEERDIFAMLEAIRSSGERAAKTVDNMLSFSRKSDSVFLYHSLPELLDNTVSLASSDYDLKKKYDFREIEIMREYDPHLPNVACEETKIQQVILNLLKNAAQSMAEPKERAEPPRIILRLFQDGNTARIEVEDNGPGMEEEVRKRVFDPFFTTKGLGVGTGLGLSVSYFIISENHGGTMTAESTPGKGSRFIIHLPIKRN